MRWAARLLVVLTFFLLIAGGLVTSTGSGLAVPDWPLSYGRLMPPMVGGILFEHGHRMIAGAVGLFTLGLALWIARREPRRGVRALAFAALGAVVAQALLGGLTVLWRLPAPVSVAHAMLGPTFFVLVVLLAGDSMPAQPARVPERAIPSPELTSSALLALIALYGQLLLGAVLRHAGWAPKFLAAHIIGAIATAGIVLATAWRVLAQHGEDAWLARRAQWLAGLVLAQLGLGLWTFISHATVISATAHVAVGALLLANAAALWWRARDENRSASRSGPVSVYLELTKPRLTLLAVITTWVGLHVGATGPLAPGLVVAALLGAALVGGGAGALNQYLEWPLDGRMIRTQRRPLPSGRLAPDAARVFGWGLSVSGLAVLALFANGLSALLGAATLLTYLAVYTPLKTRTPLCTLVGAIPGALPPLIGWAAARGTIDAGGWGLFALMFLWQLPHFLALAWMYRDDYARAGFKMLPAIDPSGRAVSRQIALSCLVLVPASLVPTMLRVTGNLYFAAALLLGLAFLGVGTAAAVAQTTQSARRLFLASVTYLPGLLAVMAWDKTPW